MKGRLIAQKLPVWQFAKFCAVGLVNTLVGYSTVLFTSFVVGLNPYAANVCGYAVGLMVSFVLNRRFTFASQQAILPGLAKFLMAFLPSYGLNLLVLYICLEQLLLPEYLAQALAMGSYSITFFTLCRVFVFRAPSEIEGSDDLDEDDAVMQKPTASHAGRGDIG